MEDEDTVDAACGSSVRDTLDYPHGSRGPCGGRPVGVMAQLRSVAHSVHAKETNQHK
jgi:hypothetical protein